MSWLNRKRCPGMRSLGSSDAEAVLRFFESRPVDAVLARVAVEDMGLSGHRGIGLFDAANELTGFAWDWGNVIPLGFDAAGLDLLAEELLGKWRSATSMVGPSDQVMGLWERVEGQWGPAREIRRRQHSMVMGERLKTAPDPLVRQAELSDMPIVFPASVAMYIEEVGQDPTAFGNAYERRAEGLVMRGHTFIRTAPAADGVGERVVFKADVGALAGGVAQIQGVWVPPDLRGRGIATSGIAASVALIREKVASTVSLYVNDFNEPAVAVYRKVGFDAVGEWTTIYI
ncbi:MAG: GNAT family N-acetyltransferase [Peptidiphaga gingivicola]